VQQLDQTWRLIGTALGFLIFGIGALAISVVVFPAIHLVAPSRQLAHRRCQYIVHLSFRLFIWFVGVLRIISYQVIGAEKLKGCAGRVIIANHPSLLDVVFIVSLVPQAKCVVKKAAWSNPFHWGVLRATGYIQSSAPEELIEACATALRNDDNLIIFPEGTRTVPGRSMQLRRGAAAVISRSDRPFVPLVITCVPAAFTKAEKWYRIPPRRAHFTISVGEPVDWRTVVEHRLISGRVNRQLTKSIKDILEQGVLRHEQHS
jgi:1-acyl-sn-glycerol-3-phosphate acyltransferase